MTARRSPIFRNSDESLRSLERTARAGDPQAALRLAIALRRAGRGPDPEVDAAIALLPEDRGNDLLAAWAVAGGDGRIRLYRALRAAGVRYPEPAFLAALSGDERVLCLVASMYGRSDAWYSRLEAFGLQSIPHAAEIVYQSSERMLSRPDREGNTDQYLGLEGLERARAEGVVIEREWAELVTTRFDHKDGGFVEYTACLTQTGYAWRSIYFYGDSRGSSGVSSWSYDVRNGFLPDWPDEGGAVRDSIFQIVRGVDLPLVAAVHRLELQVGMLLHGAGRSPQEHVPDWLVDRALRDWRANTPKALVLGDGPCGGHSGPVARCLVVIPAVPGGIPAVTIGVTSRSHGITPRTRRVTPAYFWPELAPWSEPPNRNLVKRLADWAATDAPDRIRVDGNTAFVWQEWIRRTRQRLEEMYRVHRAAERARTGH